MPKSNYRVSVKGLCVTEGRLLLVKESDSLGGRWELPGGGLQHGECIEDGLRREIWDEMGLEVTFISNVPKYVWPNHLLSSSTSDLHTLVLAYEIKLSSLSFKPSAECVDLTFASRQKLRQMYLHDQAAPLRHLFNPFDFIPTEGPNLSSECR